MSRVPEDASTLPCTAVHRKQERTLVHGAATGGSPPPRERRRATTSVEELFQATLDEGMPEPAAGGRRPSAHAEGWFGHGGCTPSAEAARAAPEEAGVSFRALTPAERVSASRAAP